MSPPAPHVGDDEILDLVHDLLDPVSRDRVLAHTSSCPDCEHRLRDAVGTHERGRARAEQALRGAEAGAAEIAPARDPVALPRHRRERPRWAMPVLAAAGVLIVSGVVWLRRPAAPHAPLAANARHAWLPSDFDRAPRRPSTAPAESLVMSGIAAYDARDLVAAESLLATPLDDFRLESLRRLYLASTRVAAGRPADAAGLLEVGMMEYLPEPWAGEMHWTLAIVLANTGRGAAADSLIRLLAARDDDVGARARALLDAARNRR